MRRRSFAPLLLAYSAGLRLSQAESRPLPVMRISEDGWGDARISDLRAVLNSAASILWPYFPDRKIEPIYINRTRTGPMVHYERNYLREIVMDLDSEGMLWCQYSYQFGHEFCHILSGFDQDGTANLWFEETLCEAASLFTLRHMAEQWRTAPPFPNWKSYANALNDYADKVIKDREKIAPGQLPAFYRKHATDLRANPTRRELNGAMSLVFLEIFEQSPSSWEAITWLNSRPSAREETFPFYLNKWLKAAPARHQPFIAGIIRAFDLK